MDLFSRSGFSDLFFSIHVMIRRFGVFRILLTIIGVAIVISGLVGSTILVQQSQETRKYASAGWCKVEDNGVTTGYVPCDTPGETLQGTYEQVMNIRDNAPAITSVTTEQLQAVQQQVGNANTTVNDEGKREITGGTHGGQEIITDCSGNSCNTGNEGNGAVVSGGGAPTGGAPSGGATTPPAGTGTLGNGSTADNVCTAQPDCGGPNQGYCTCGADGKPDPKGKPTCQGGYEVLGGDCVPIGTKESVSGKPGESGTHCQSDGDCGSGLICSGRVCTEKPKETSPPASTERYGITDNICHLPGANCIGDEAWRNGFAAARGDTKALDKLKSANSSVFSQVTVDGGVVKTTIPNTSASQQPTTKSIPISDEAQKRRQAETQRCSKTLHLCPMLDPSSLQIVGWVPADEAVFGTFAEAGLARQNLSIGNLFEEIEIGTEKYKAYNFNWQNLSAEQLAKMSGMTDPKEIERIAQTAEKNKVTTNASGRIVIDEKYDIKKFEEDNKKFWEDQQGIQTKILESVSKKDDPKVFQKYLDECRADFNTPCSETELWNYVREKTHVELLPPESQKSIKDFVTDASKKYIEFIQKQKEAEVVAQQRKESLSKALTTYVNSGNATDLMTLCASYIDASECRSVDEAITALFPNTANDIRFQALLSGEERKYLQGGNGEGIITLCKQKHGQNNSGCGQVATALKMLDPDNATNISQRVVEIEQAKSAQQKILEAANIYIQTGGDSAVLIAACEALPSGTEKSCGTAKDILTRYLDGESAKEIIAKAKDTKNTTQSVQSYASAYAAYVDLCPTYKVTGQFCDNTKGSSIAISLEKYQKEFDAVIQKNNPTAIGAVIDAYQANKLKNDDLLAVCQTLQSQGASISCSGDQTSIITSLMSTINPNADSTTLNEYAGQIWMQNKMQNLSLAEKGALTLSPLIPELQAGGPLGKYITKQNETIWSDGHFTASDLLTVGDTLLDPLGIRHNLVEQERSIFDDQIAALQQGKTDVGTAALTVTGRGANAITFGAFSTYVAENIALNTVYGNKDFSFGSQEYKDRVFNTENLLSATKLGGIVAAEISGVASVFAAPAYVPIALGAMNLSLSTSQAASACDQRYETYSDGQCKLMVANAVVAGVSFGATTYLGEAQLAYQAASKALAAVDAGADTAQALSTFNAANTNLGVAQATNLFSTVTEGGINLAFTASSCSQGDVVGCGMSGASSFLTLGRFGLQTKETLNIVRGTAQTAEDVAAQQLQNFRLAKAGDTLAISQASITCGLTMLGQGGQEGLAQCGQALASLRTVGIEAETPKTGGGGDVDAELLAANGAVKKLAGTGSDRLLISEAEMNAIVESMAKNQANTTESLTNTLIANADTAITQARGDLAELTTIKVDNGTQKTSKAQLDVVAETVKNTTEVVRKNISDLRAAHDVAESMGDVASMQKIREQLATLSTIAKDLRATAAELSGNTTAPVTAKAVQSKLGELSVLAGSATKLANAIEAVSTVTTTVGDSTQATTSKAIGSEVVLPEQVKPLSLQEAEQIAKAKLSQSTQEYQQAQQRHDDLQTKVRDIESIDVLGRKADELNITIPQQAETTAENTAKLPQEFVAKHQDQVTKLNALAKQVNELEQSGQITKEESNRNPVFLEYKRALSDLNAALSKERATVLAQKRNVENSLGTLSNVETVRKELQSAKVVLEKSRSALASKEMDYDYAHQQRVDQEKASTRLLADSNASQEPDYSGLSLVEVRQRLGEVEQKIAEHTRTIELSDSVVEDGGETAMLQRELALFEQERKLLLLQQGKLTPTVELGVFASVQNAAANIRKAVFGEKTIVVTENTRTPVVLTDPRDIHRALTQAESVEDIVRVLQRVESITGSDGKVYSRDQLIGYVRAAEEGFATEGMITRTGGLRDALQRVLHPPTLVERGVNVLLSVQDPQLRDPGRVINLSTADGVATVVYPSSIDNEGEFVWTRTTLNGLSEQEVNRTMQRAWEAAENRRGLVTVSIELDGNRRQYNLLPPTDADASHFFSVKTEDARGWLAKALNPSGEVKPKPVANKTQTTSLRQELPEGIESLLLVRNFQSNKFESVSLQSQEMTVLLRYEVVDGDGNRQTRSVILNGLSPDEATQTMNDAWNQAGNITGKVRVDILSENKKTQTFFPSAPNGGATGNDFSVVAKDTRPLLNRLFGLQLASNELPTIEKMKTVPVISIDEWKVRAKQQLVITIDAQLLAERDAYRKANPNWEKGIAIYSDPHSDLIQFQRDLFITGRIDENGVPTGLRGVINGDLSGKNFELFSQERMTQAPGIDVMNYAHAVIEGSGGSIERNLGNWEVRLALAMAEYEEIPRQLEALQTKLKTTTDPDMRKSIELDMKFLNENLLTRQQRYQDAELTVAKSEEVSLIDQLQQFSTILLEKGKIITHYDTSNALKYSIPVKNEVQLEMYLGELRDQRKITDNDAFFLRSVFEERRSKWPMTVDRMKSLYTIYQKIGFTPDEIAMNINLTTSSIVRDAVRDKSPQSLYAISNLEKNVSANGEFYRHPENYKAFSQFFTLDGNIPILVHGHTPLWEARNTAKQFGNLMEEVSPGVFMDKTKQIVFFATDDTPSRSMRTYYKDDAGKVEFASKYALPATSFLTPRLDKVTVIPESSPSFIGNQTQAQRSKVLMDWLTTYVGPVGNIQKTPKTTVKADVVTYVKPVFSDVMKDNTLGAKGFWGAAIPHFVLPNELSMGSAMKAIAPHYSIQ